MRIANAEPRPTIAKKTAEKYKRDRNAAALLRNRRRAVTETQVRVPTADARTSCPGLRDGGESASVSAYDRWSSSIQAILLRGLIDEKQRANVYTTRCKDVMWFFGNWDFWGNSSGPPLPSLSTSSKYHGSPWPRNCMSRSRRLKHQYLFWYSACLNDGGPVPDLGKINGVAQPPGLTFDKAFLNERTQWPATVLLCRTALLRL